MQSRAAAKALAGGVQGSVPFGDAPPNPGAGRGRSCSKAPGQHSPPAATARLQLQPACSAPLTRRDEDVKEAPGEGGQDMASAVERQLRIEQRRAHPERLEQQPQPHCAVHAVDKHQHLQRAATVEGLGLRDGKGQRLRLAAQVVKGLGFGGSGIASASTCSTRRQQGSAGARVQGARVQGARVQGARVQGARVQGARGLGASKR